MALISPGIEITVTDNSFYSPTNVSTVPLFIFATEGERQILTGDTLVPAEGTFESNVLRTITSFTQAYNLYGIPNFLKDANGNQLHGDSRNEYGLLAMMKYMQQNNRCYAIRADIDLNDDISRLRPLWASKMLSASVLLEALTQQRIDTYNRDSFVKSNKIITTVTTDDLVKDAETVLKAAVYTVFPFRNLHGTFFLEQSPALPVYSNGYNVAPVDPSYIGFKSFIKQGITSVTAKIATIENLRVTATNQTLTNAGSKAALVIDGTALVIGDRILIKDQIDETQNGVYQVTKTGSVVENWVLTRTVDFDTSGEMMQASYVYVSSDFNDSSIKPTIFKMSTNYTKYDVKYASNVYLKGKLSIDGNVLTNDGIKTNLVVGGSLPVIGDKVLIKDQEYYVTDPITKVETFVDLSNQNGIYQVTDNGSPTTNWVLTRIAEFNQSAEIVNDIFVNVGTGTTATVYQTNVTLPLTIGTDPIKFVKSTGYGYPMGFDVVTEVSYTPSEAAQLLLDAAADFQYTVEFRDLTSLSKTGSDVDRRAAIVESIKRLINTNQDIRSEIIDYNLIVCPGFYEVNNDLDRLVRSVDLNEESFIISDTPMNMTPQEVAEWGSKSKVFSELIGYYYPHGVTSNIDGTAVVVPASLGMVNVYAYNDRVTDVWYAPAGTQRGAIRDFDRVGYIQGTIGTATSFVDLSLTRGDRDNLYKLGTNINPIANLPARGIHAMGQKTATSNTSARDRVKANRLICYIRRRLRNDLIPFLFQPLDQYTRDSANNLVSGILAGIVADRGLHDFAVNTDSGVTVENLANHVMEVWVALQITPDTEFILVKINIEKTTG